MTPAFEPLARLRDQMAPYNTKATLAEVGRMMAMAENAGFELRLNTVAQVAMSLPPDDGRPAAGRHRLETWSNGDIVAGLNADEDPPEFPVAEPLRYRGRVYMIAAGQLEELAFRVEHLLMAIDRMPGTDAVLLRRWSDLARATLEVAEATCERAGLASGTAPRRKGGVQVRPGAGGLVTWTALEIEHLLGAEGLTPAALEPLLVDAGTGDPFAARGSRANNGVAFVRFPDGDLVVLPVDVLPALAHVLMSEVRAAGIGDVLAAAFAEAVELAIGWSLVVGLGLEVVDVPPMASASPTARLSAFRAPGDLLVLVHLSSDPFANFDPDIVVDECDLDASLGRAQALDLEALAWAATEAAPGERTLVVRVPALLPNRHGGWATSAPQPPVETLVILPAALGVIATLEHPDPLALAKFAIAVRELHEQAQVLCWNTLDLYAAYRQHEHSFYESDETRPVLAVVPSDFGLGPRLEAIARLRAQSAHLPGSGHVEVFAKYPDEPAPIFIPPATLPGYASVARVDTSDLWVLGPSRGTVTADTMGLYVDVVDAVAYWLWQVSAHLQTAFPTAFGATLVFRVQIERPEDWSHREEPSEKSVGAVPDPDVPGLIHVWLDPGFATIAGAPHNAADRWLLAEIVQAVLVNRGLKPIPDEVMSLVDAAAPLGQKKMLTVIPADGRNEIGGRDGLPRLPKVDEWASGRVLDEAADDLAAAGFTPGDAGTIPEQVVLINHMVRCMYERLVEEVAELSPAGLLEDLFRQNEALVRENGLRRVHTPTRVACFGVYSDMGTRLVRETRDHTIASVATRFLLEYIAATPPSGTAELNAWRWERLLALAATIVDYGFQSDVTQYGLEKTDARILPSGRLGTRRDRFAGAVKSYMSAVMPSHIRDTQEAFGRGWAEGNDDSVPTDVDEAYAAEFGYTLTQLAAVSAALADAVPAGEAVGAARRSMLVTGLAIQTGESVDTVAAVVDSLSLGPRNDYLRAPTGFSPSDIYPWLFNRRLSLVRRPLVLRGDDTDPELVWGWRGVFTSVKHTLYLAHQGRLAASSKLMLDFIALKTKEASDDFVESVRASVVSLGLDARVNVKRFASTRIQVNGQDLGDVDVLGVDRVRRILWAIECKNLAFAKTPHELSSEIRGLNEGEHSMVAKHARRIAWLRSNVEVVRRALGLEDGPWQVEGLITVREGLMATHLRSMTVPVIAFDDLPQHLASRQRAVRAARPRGKSRKRR